MSRRAVLLLCVAFLPAAFFLSRATVRAVGAEAQGITQQSEFDAISHSAEASSRAAGAGAASRLEKADIWMSPYQNVFAQHRDMAAWLKIDGTAVDCPVMQTPDDPDFYLTHGLDGAQNRAGIPYLQCNCRIYTSDNLVVYGHSMRNGTMFAALLNYTAAEYWREHPEIRLDTRTESRTYRIFAVFRESVAPGAKNVLDYWNFVDAESPDAYRNFTAQLKRRALYETGVTVSPGEQLLTLSTCEYTLNDGRLAVAAKRIS